MANNYTVKKRTQTPYMTALTPLYRVEMLSQERAGRAK